MGSETQVFLSTAEETAYIESIGYEGTRIPFVASDITATLHSDLPAEPQVVVVYIDGRQVEHREMALGERVVECSSVGFSPRNLSRASSVSIAFVKGGDGDWDEWTGGEILERVELDVREAIPI